jgi:hypothetical protein
VAAQKKALGKTEGFFYSMVERMGIEPTTFALRTRRSPS